PQASPTVVDAQVTVPVVTTLQGVTDVNEIDSDSASGASIIEVEFNDGTDEQTDLQNLNAALTRIQGSLPATAKAPDVEAFSTSELPILQYSVYGNASLATTSSRLETVAVPRLQGLAGVATVSVSGAPTQEVQVTLDPQKLTADGVSMSQVVATLESASLVQSVGSLQDNGQAVPVRISSSLQSLAQIAALTVTPSASATGSSGQGSGSAGQGSGSGAEGSGSQGQNGSGGTTSPARSPVAIGDLGTVTLSSVPADTITRTNGRLSIGMNILKTPSSDTVTVANEVKKALPGIAQSMGGGTHFQIITDEATPITNAISGILREGLLGALFAILVIFAFLRSARATLVAAISIPLSLLVALLILWWQDITLNILTLGGMMVAIGRVVDDAIVVLENISRHINEGERPLVASYNAAREILTAVTSSTLTTVAVFLPIIFLTGIAGDFFRPFALTVVTALLASLAVAVTVVPLLASRLLPKPRRQGTDVVSGWLQRRYVPVIRFATSHRPVVLLVALAILVVTAGLVPRLSINLLDQSAGPDVSVNLAMPMNATLAQTNAQTEAVERLIHGTRGVSAYQATVGGTPDPFAPPGSIPADPTTASITVVADATADPAKVLNRIRSRVRSYHGAAKVTTAAGQNSSTSGTSQVQEVVHDSNAATLDQSTQKVISALKGISGLSQVTSNLTTSKPEYVLTPTPALSSSGLTLQQLAGLVSAAVQGDVATEATLSTGETGVVVQLPPGTADTPASLASFPVPTATGSVPLSNLATLQEVPGPQSVNRTNGQQTATITANITGSNTRAVQNRVDKALNKVKLPGGVSVSAGGAFSELSTVLTQFILAILGAIGLVYLIMVATFRSLLKPLVLLAAIPFAATGAIVALVATHTALSLPSLVGLLMLIGIVVTNAIVLLDLVEQYRARGLGVQEALIEGGRHRLRPILMTALATMLALAPLAASGENGGGGAFISAPLAIVVIGGLFTSTFLSLVILPVLYSYAAPFANDRSRQRELDGLLDRAAQNGSSELPEPARMHRGDRPVVTLCADAGLPVAEIGASVASRLNVRLVDLSGGVENLSEALMTMLTEEAKARADFARLLRRLSASAADGGEGLLRPRLREAALELITRSGGVVCGAPAAVLPLGVELGGLRVRLTAPADRRMQLMRGADEEEAAARERLEAADAADQAAWAEAAQGAAAGELYHLALDPTALSLDACASLIATAAETGRQAAAAPSQAVPAPS
ncbi:MAG TPA: efflux RND transporter permease subunit, partial [Candidatus Dormibacteraeota bacterium]|nr:efflux RND transporter permease subunit [Candidatus Dormibacteraeota bacterium]